MRYEILKDFMGSQDGSTAEPFTAGTIAELSDYLAAAIDPSWARLVDEKPGEEPSAAKDERHLFTKRGKAAK